MLFPEIPTSWSYNLSMGVGACQRKFLITPSGILENQAPINCYLKFRVQVVHNLDSEFYSPPLLSSTKPAPHLVGFFACVRMLLNSSIYNFASEGSSIINRFSSFVLLALSVKLYDPVITIWSSITIVLLCKI